MHPRQIESREIKDRRMVLDEVFELLPPSIVQGTARLLPGPESSRILRSDRGVLYGQFYDHALAQFTLQAPDHLRAFKTYIEQLEQGAYYERERRREAETQLAEVSNELLAADGLGITTKDGQRRVRSAIASVRDRGRRGR